MFVKRGKVLYSLKDKNESVIYYDETDESRNYPIVIITNNNTASSSELVALALKENNGALIVGTTTFGKGKVQQTQGLGNNSMIKYTTAKWYSPNNNCIDEVGPGCAKCEFENESEKVICVECEKDYFLNNEKYCTFSKHNSHFSN